MNTVWILGGILLLNLAISAGVGIWGFLKRDRVKYLLIAGVIFLCPVVGVLYFSLSHLYFLLFYKKQIDTAGLSPSKDKIHVITPPDFKEEISVVPLEEALLVSDKGNMRRSLLNLLKHDFENSLEVIAMALGSEDTETSHYAASVIMDVIAKYKTTLQKMRTEYEKDVTDGTRNKKYADSVYRLIVSGALSDIEVKTYIQLFHELCENLYVHHPDLIEGGEYKNLVDQLLRIGDTENAGIWATRGVREKSDHQDTHMALLKYYYTLSMEEKFFQAMGTLKTSDVPLTNEMLSIVRFYSMHWKPPETPDASDKNSDF